MTLSCPSPCTGAKELGSNPFPIASLFYIYIFLKRSKTMGLRRR